MPVRYLRQWVRDICASYGDMALRNLAEARLAIGGVERALASLADRPDLGRPGRVGGTMELEVPATRFVIVYRVAAGEVQALALLNKTRRYP